jgi:hypothetical protein
MDPQSLPAQIVAQLKEREPPRLATADILFLIKERALENMRHTTAGEVCFLVAVLAVAYIVMLIINRTLLGSALQVKRLTIPAFFMAIYVVLMSLPSIVWFYASPKDPVRYTYFMAMQVPLVAFPLGMFFANALLGGVAYSAAVVTRFVSAPLERTEDDRYAVRYWLLMFGLSVLVAGVYLMTSSYVPLLGAFTSYGEEAPQMVRRAIVAEGVAIHYGHALTARLLLPFCLLYSYFMAYQWGGRWRLLFWPTLGVAAFVSALTFDRMFPFSVVLYLVLAIYFKYEDQAARAEVAGLAPRKRMSKLKLVGYVGALLAVAMLVGGIVSLTQFNKAMDLEIIWVTSSDFLFNRVLLDPSFMAWIYFEEFNVADKLLMGTGIHVLISRAMGWEFYATISPSFVAELWVNFGWYGVTIGSMLVGFVLQLIQVRVFDRKTVPSLSLFIIMALNGAWVVYGHLLATMVISVYLPSILIVAHLKRRRKAAALAAQRIASHKLNVAHQ